LICYLSSFIECIQLENDGTFSIQSIGFHASGRNTENNELNTHHDETFPVESMAFSTNMKVSIYADPPNGTFSPTALGVYYIQITQWHKYSIH